MKSRTNTIPPRTNGTNTSPWKPTPATSTSPTSTSPTSPAAAVAASAVLHPSIPPPTTPLQTQTPITPTLNRNLSPITTTTAIQHSSNSSSSHQISPTYPSAQCPSSPHLPSTRTRIQIDCPRGTTIRAEERKLEVSRARAPCGQRERE